MNATIESIAKWQPPSVLHLLPFSKNNAGTSLSTSIVTAQSNQQATYAQDANNNKGLPGLGSSLQGKEKQRSKSAAVMEHKIQIHKQQQQHRLFRASSERLSRSPKKPVGRRDFIERARSEYGVKSDRKLTQEVVTFAINDINEQILGQTNQNENESPTLDKTSTLENGRYKVKSLLKPVVKLNEGRWPQTNARFWRSSMISPGERELQRHKSSLDAQLYALKRSKMVKLNVKDLPRSQTPIGETDPDKLNMKQVIAFLQSSGDVRDVDDEVTKEKRRIGNSNSKRNNPENLKDIDKFTEQKDNSAALLIAAKSRRKEESSDNSFGITKTGPACSIQPSKPNIKDNISKTDNNNNLDPIVKPRPNSYNGEVPSKPTEGGKHNQETPDNNQNNPRPKSLQFLRENTDFRIPAGIRHIRESTVDNRPFRLHRFLTLVSSTPENTTPSKHKVSSRNNSNNSRFTSPSPSSGNNNRSSSTTSKTKDDENSNKTFTDSNGFFLTRNGSTNNEYERKNEGRRRFKHTHSPTQTKTDVEYSIGNGKVICLPTAHVDIESDDDSNFISLPTVPSKATRKDLVLSAHGRAMLTKSFPSVDSFKRAIIRPHSEKLTLNRRLEINGDVKTRPSTVKATDLVEWDGVDNPEKIFLTDRSDNDPSIKRSSDTSNSTPNLTNGTTNGEPPSDGLKEIHDSNSPHPSEHFNTSSSPSRSKNSDDVITFPSENRSTDAFSDNSKEAVVGKYVAKNNSGAKSKSERVSRPLSDPVRLTLRKERNLTREKTYMVDMESTGGDLFGQRPFMRFEDNMT